MATHNLEFDNTSGGRHYEDACVIVDGRTITGSLYIVDEESELPEGLRESIRQRIALLGGTLSEYAFIANASFESIGIGSVESTALLMVRREAISAMGVGQYETRDMPEEPDLQLFLGQ